MTTATAATMEQPQQAMVRDGFAEVSEAQQYLRLSRATIYNLMESGALRFARFGRTRRIPWASLRDYAARNLVAV
jgi:excisionase family DNA binding protein